MSTLRVNNVAEAGGAPVITSGVLDSGSLPAGSVLQVVSTTLTSAFTTTSTSMVDVTGLSVSITPSSTSSKIYVALTIGAVDRSSAGSFQYGDVTRNGTAIGIGDVNGVRSQIGWLVCDDGLNRPSPASWTYLDSPSSTSALTYQARFRTESGTGFINRASTDSNITAYFRSISTITVMEIAG